MMSRRTIANSILFAFVLSGIALTYTGAPLIVSVLITAALLPLAFVLHKQPALPEVLFTVFGGMYIIAFPIQVLFFGRTGFLNEFYLGVIVQAGLFFFLGFFGSALVLSRLPSSISAQGLFSRYDFLSNRSPFPQQFILAILVCLLFGLIVWQWMQVWGADAAAKHQLPGFGRLAVVVYVFSALLYVLLVRAIDITYRFGWIFFAILFALPFVLHFAFTGERDVIVRAGLVILVLGVVGGHLCKGAVFFLLLGGLVLQPIMQALKAFLVIGWGDIYFSWAGVFSGEFSAQGRNFYWALERPIAIENVYTKSILNDILRFFYLTDRSSASLFGRMIMDREGGPGLGFTLLGQMYFSAGYFGVFLLGASIAGVLRAFEPTSGGRMLVYAYAFILFGCAYALRADVANFLSNIIKVGLFPILTALFLLFFLDQFLRASRKARGVESTSRESGLNYVVSSA